MTFDSICFYCEHGDDANILYLNIDMCSALCNYHVLQKVNKCQLPHISKRPEHGWWFFNLLNEVERRLFENV